MITLQVRDGESIRIEVVRETEDPWVPLMASASNIRCAECGGTDTEPRYPGCSGVIHPTPEAADEYPAARCDLCDYWEQDISRNHYQGMLWGCCHNTKSNCYNQKTMALRSCPYYRSGEAARPEPGDNERARARELFSAARAVVAAGQAWHRIGDPQSAERLSLAIGRLEAAIEAKP